MKTRTISGVIGFSLAALALVPGCGTLFGFEDFGSGNGGAAADGGSGVDPEGGAGADSGTAGGGAPSAGRGGTLSSAGRAGGASGSGGTTGSSGSPGTGGGGAGTGGGSSGTTGEGGGSGAPCSEQVRVLAPFDGVSLDYGPDPKDGPFWTTLEVSSGFAHDHIHDIVTWLLFDLEQVPPGAEVVGMTLTVQCVTESGEPPLDVRYSSAKDWRHDTATPALVPVTDSLGVVGTLAVGAQSYTVDVDAYRRYWANDLSDGRVTLGLGSTSPPNLVERWGTLEALGNPDLAPRLTLTTCE